MAMASSPPITRRQLLGGGVLLACGWLGAVAIGHRPLVGTGGVLGAGRHTLAAAFEILLPAQADCAQLAAEVDAFLGEGDPVLAGQLRTALALLEHTGGARPWRVQRFSLQSRQARQAVLSRWRVSRLGVHRQIADAVRRVALFTWYSNPASWDSIGYDGPWVGR